MAPAEFARLDPDDICAKTINAIDGRAVSQHQRSFPRQTSRELHVNLVNSKKQARRIWALPLEGAAKADSWPGEGTAKRRWRDGRSVRKVLLSAPNVTGRRPGRLIYHFSRKLAWPPAVRCQNSVAVEAIWGTPSVAGRQRRNPCHDQALSGVKILRGEAVENDRRATEF